MSGLKFDMSWPIDQIAKFIAETESGVYEGVSEDGLEARVDVVQGRGLIVRYISPEKPKWYQCVEFDEDGCQVGDWVEAVNK